MNITILCKVVDNFGDIGVCYRLAKNLLSIEPALKISMVIDGLDSFSKICSFVNPLLNYQHVEGFDVYDWSDFSFCHDAFSEQDGKKMEFILECFQCGRPDWMEKILFEDGLRRTVHVLMIDYLTAEKYAEDFHCLQSLTRSAKVQKVNFMPGFTSRTGGLILDGVWQHSHVRNAGGPVLFFMYDDEWLPLANALARTGKTVLVAQGKGRDSFLDACGSSGCADVRQLPFMNQAEWDETLLSCSALFVRGEDSLSRACLSGIPFVWQAYPQSEDYQIVKVEALLSVMKVFFKEEDFEFLRKLWLDFNVPSGQRNGYAFEDECFEFLRNADKFEEGFANFAISLRKNGSLGDNVMTFLKKITII